MTPPVANFAARVQVGIAVGIAVGTFPPAIALGLAVGLFEGPFAIAATQLLVPLCSCRPSLFPSPGWLSVGWELARGQDSHAEPIRW